SELPTTITDTFESWGLPLLEGTVTSDPERTVTAAEAIGYPVVVKGEASGLAHRTEIGAVEVNLRGPEQVREAFARVADSLGEAGYRDTRIRVQPYRPGLEVIVGGFIDGSLGP